MAPAATGAGVAHRVGIVADTHGHIGTKAIHALAGVTRILHAGDVGGTAVLETLRRVAPVDAVRGNAEDDPEIEMRLPAFTVVDVAGVRFAVTHVKDRAYRVDDARRAGCDVYVFGHTHVASSREDGGLWLVNPGSASKSRGGTSPSVAIVDVAGGRVLRVETIPV